MDGSVTHVLCSPSSPQALSPRTIVGVQQPVVQPVLQPVQSQPLTPRSIRRAFNALDANAFTLRVRNYIIPLLFRFIISHSVCNTQCPPYYCMLQLHALVSCVMHALLYRLVHALVCRALHA